MFPFYVYVNRVNRERDKNTLLFPLIDHFYGMMKKTQAIYCFLWFFLFFLFEKIEDIGKQKESISTYLMYGIPLAALCLCVLAISVQESKPQIYIFCQTITVLIVKMIYTPYFLFIHNFKTMIISTRIWDAFSIPVIIQISYLTCNRQNVITLFASFKGMKLVKELIKPEATTRVSPDPGRHRI
ncbi:hypothetical protein L3Y34_009579 [Caenorhabditis briggsae]|uniref:Serpentine receptor class gamma n=1 Tax=Caenorhabditis briggsae TaxID=6238 RepID=A0AAE9A310_CAEBR|nr:hypothetical protein L3Y34_009579 [Caenorhabditis briggsae]